MRPLDHDSYITNNIIITRSITVPFFIKCSTITESGILAGGG